MSIIDKTNPCLRNHFPVGQLQPFCETYFAISFLHLFAVWMHESISIVLEREKSRKIKGLQSRAGKLFGETLGFFNLIRRKKDREIHTVFIHIMYSLKSTIGKERRSFSINNAWLFHDILNKNESLLFPYSVSLILSRKSQCVLKVWYRLSTEIHFAVRVLSSSCSIYLSKQRSTRSRPLTYDQSVKQSLIQPSGWLCRHTYIGTYMIEISFVLSFFAESSKKTHS